MGKDFIQSTWHGAIKTIETVNYVCQAHIGFQMWEMVCGKVVMEEKVLGYFKKDKIHINTYKSIYNSNQSEKIVNKVEDLIKATIDAARKMRLIW